MTRDLAGQLPLVPRRKRSIRSRHFSESDAAISHTKAIPVLQRSRSTSNLHYPYHSVHQPSIPRPTSREVFSSDPAFVSSDVGARAIIDIMQHLDLSTDIRSAESAMRTVCRYRTHPDARNLTKGLASSVRSREPIRLAFAAATGEVMYVVHPRREVIIAARSGMQRDLPHPTLIGELDPEALSAGLVFFRDGRISRVFINASGHFKPNGLSSIEVSLALFSRLPPEAFHLEFEGYRVFHHGQQDGVPFPGPAPRAGNPFAPFSISDVDDTPGSLERTQALARTEQMRDTLRLLKTRKPKQKAATSGALIKYLTARSTDPVLFALMDREMKARYASILRAVAGAQGGQPTTEIITKHADYRTLIDALEQRLNAFPR